MTLRKGCTREFSKASLRNVAAARELRDRWLEKVNDDPSILTAQGKYQVSRILTSTSSVESSAVVGSKSLVAPTAPLAANIPLLEAA